MDINDKFLDSLITETLSRQELERDIEKTVMTTLKRQHRRSAIRLWARIAAFSFGLPTAVLAYLWAMKWVITNVEAASYVWPAMILSAVTVIAVALQAAAKYSPREM